MTDDQVDELLKKIDQESVVVAPTFQAEVWRGVEGKGLSFLPDLGFTRLLALRAAPAALALVVGGVAGTSMITEPTEQDLLGVFSTNAEWSLVSIIDGGESS
jgi:hypothetical protein